MRPYIYKILREFEWQTVRESAVPYRGSPDDIKDGFIHFSTREQLAGTAEKHFSKEMGIHVLAYSPTIFPLTAIKWEKSRGGVLFPHLYGHIEKNSHTRHWLMKRTAGDTFDFTCIEEREEK